MGCADKKGVSLSESEKSALDVKLFNELDVRSMAWREKTYEARYKLITDMAEKGYMPAKYAIKLLKINGGNHFLPFKVRAFINQYAYKELKEHANKGDPSMQCLFFMVVYEMKNEGDYPLANEYMQKAADQGHPRCMDMYGKSLRKGMSREDVAPKESIDYIEAAARKGDQKAALSIALTYAGGYWGFEVNAGKARCWLAVAKVADTGKVGVDYSNMIERIARRARDKGKNIIVGTTYSASDRCE
ncbi:MAG: hypothetical protein OQL16_12325 [Gammaproteobacteria bacterium]|nr:hypothetical protein [Gammaproteobacteria bacterium]